MKLIPLAALLLALCSLEPAAADCRVRQRVVVQQQVQAVALVATLAVPAYSVSVDPVGLALLDEVRAIRKELAALRGGVAPGGPADLKALVTADCAKCHGAKVAADKGGEFVLVEDDGSLPALSLPERRRIIEVTDKGAMPPKAPLSDARKAEFRAALKTKTP